MANSVYIANASAGANDGSSCANAKAASYFNTVGNWSATPSGIQIGPDTTVHLCGTISTTLTAQGSGSSGHPIIILFESGAKISQALCPSTGCLVLDNKTDITIDGGGTGSVALGTFVSNGLIENTASGSSLANTNPTTYGISAGAVNRVTVQNLLCQNIYVMIANSGTPISDSSTARCMSFSGSNITINNNVAHDCGWCFMDTYKNGDTNVTFSNNELSAFSHGLTLATTTSNAAASNFFVFNNKFHDPSNWAVGGCGGIHVDALHIFATGGATLGNTIDNVYFHDNHMYGSYGTCASAHFFVEGGGSSDKANLVNGWFFNNVSQVPNGAIPISWHEIFSATGSVSYINNTIQGPGNADNTFCANIGSTNNTTIKNNVFTGCGGQINVGSLTGVTTIDYNFYDTTCNSGNCWVWNGSFVGGTFAQWKTHCSCDANAKQNATPLLNADGTPQAGSPVIKQADNLGSIATGNLAGLQNDSSNGGIRTQFARPASGSCSSQGNLPCWDIGAFQFAAAGGGSPGVTTVGSIKNFNVTFF